MKPIVLLAALLCSLCFIPSARATYDPLGSGAMKLFLDRSFASFLKENGIKLTASQGAKKKGSFFILPVSGGNLDPTIGKGEIDTEGTLVFQSQRKRLPLRKIRLKTTHSPLIAKVGGSQLKAASSSKLSFKRAGFASSFEVNALKLTSKLTTRLNKKLRPKAPFTAGQLLGKLESQALPRLTTILEGGRATLVFDQDFLSKLASHFVSLNPIFPAERQGASFSFPIAVGGAIAPNGTAGTLRTGGVVELLQLGGGQVFWAEQWLDLGARQDSAEVDLEPAPAFPGKVGRVGVFDTAPGQLSANPLARTISDAEVALTLQANTAKALNDAFDEGKTLFVPGEAIGALSFTAQGQ